MKKLALALLGPVAGFVQKRNQTLPLVALDFDVCAFDSHRRLTSLSFKCFASARLPTSGLFTPVMIETVFPFRPFFSRRTRTGCVPWTAKGAAGFLGSSGGVRSGSGTGSVE